MLGITNHHNSMILSTLSISSRGFSLKFSKKPHTNRDVFVTYEPMTIPRLSPNYPQQFTEKIDSKRPLSWQWLSIFVEKKVEMVDIEQI